MKKLLPSLILLFFVSWHSFSQNHSKEYVFKYINENQGLSNNHIQSIIKDRMGFIWFGTANGLNRFDGTRMKTFYHVENDSTTLSNSYIWRILEGPEGNLWIRNVNDGFDIYLLEEGRITRNSNAYVQEYKLRSDRIVTILQDQKGRFWFAHPEEGISVYDPISGNSRYLIQNSTKVGSLSFNQVSSLDLGPYGEVWAVYSNGAVDVINTQSLAVTQTMELSTVFKAGRPVDWEIFADSEGKAWIYSPNLNFGIFRMDPKDESITHYHDNSSPLFLKNNLVKTIIEKKKGEYWIGTDHGGLNILDFNSGNSTFIMHHAELGTGLSENTIYCLYKDEDEMVWIGTVKKGVNFYHDGFMQFVHIKSGNNGSLQSLPYNDINVFEEDSLGNLYLGTNGNGLYYYDRQKNKYTHFLADPKNPNSLSGNVVVELKIDHDGILWIGTYLQGLSRFDGKNFKKYGHDPNDQQSISDVNVWNIHIDKNNDVWVGTLRGGLNKFDRERQKFIRYGVGVGDIPINNQYISSFGEDKEGNLWIGGGYGIDILNLETGYQDYYSGLDPELGLTGNNITKIFRDSEDVMWVATSQGLNYLDTQTGKFHGFSKQDGLPTDFLLSILEDEEQNLWASSQNGLSYVRIDRSVSPYQLSIRNFDVSDGLQARLFNKNAALKTASGELIFGGPNGYNIFRTANFAFSLNNPKVVFTGLQLFNKPVNMGEELDGGVILPRNISNTQNIVLKHYQNIFSIDFTSLNFLDFKKNKFRYKLEGFNQEWSVLDEPPFKVTYTNLDPGNYTLVVQASQNDGQWSDEEGVMEIRILAPFWKTPLAYFLYFILAVIIAYLARRQILEKERQQFRRLEEKREAQRLLELDQLKTRFFTNVSHEFRTPLTLILAPLERLLNDNPNEKTAHQYLTIQKNAKRLLQLVNQILDVKNIEKNGMVFNPSEGDIVRFIESKVGDFEDLMEKKHIRLNFETSIKKLPTKFDADKVEKIIFNLLSNAFKFTPDEGKINVMVSLDDILDEKGVLMIRVKDTGIGIRAEDLDKVFDRYFTVMHTSVISNQGSGIGLSVSREFARMHGGDIVVKSEIGRGSEFTVTLEVPVKMNLLDFETHLDESHEELEVEKNEIDKPGILLVEDNLEFRQYMKEFLEEEFHVWVAQDGKEGIEKALTNIPDLIISDLMMPIMDGVELCQHLKKDLKTSHIPIIILTARSSEEKQLEGLQSGCNLFISKPFKLEILMTSIRNLLSEQERLQKHFRKKISVSTSEQEIESLDDRLIQKAMELVEKHMENTEFSVEQMSRELGMSRVHLYKKLSALTGKSPVEFIRLVRLQRAAQLLLKSQFTISEIAYKVGFNNAKYFTKHFKAEFGVPPSLYAQGQSVQ